MILQSINALTLCCADMAKSCAFYSTIGLTPTFGGPDAQFTTFSANAPVTEENNAMHINLVLAPAYRAAPSQPGAPGGWGRAVIFVDRLDELHASLTAAGIRAPQPRDAPWGERYFHVSDPDGHELSFATPDYTHPRWAHVSSALDESLQELQAEKTSGARVGEAL